MLNQNLDKSDFEIIVVKNFTNTNIDKLIEENGIKNILTDTGPVGGKFSEGIAASRGRVLSFLEDDDLFLPSKLGWVKQLFEDDKNLVYYHNTAISLYDDKTEAMDGHHPKIPEPLLYRGSKQIFEAMEYITTGVKGSLNVSCISILRDGIKDKLTQFRNVTRNPDGFVFLTAITPEGHFRVDGEFLTKRRIHSAGMSQLEGSSFRDSMIKKRNFALGLPVDNRMIFDALSDDLIRNNFWDMKSNLWVEIESIFYSSKQNRKGMISSGIRYMKNRQHRTGKVPIFFYTLFVVYILIPAVSKFLYSFTIWLRYRGMGNR